MHTVLRFFLIIFISGLFSPAVAQEEDFFIGDFVCDEAQRDLGAGDEFTTTLELPLVMITAFVHINRTNAGTDLDENDGCALASIVLDNGDEIVILKFLDISGEFASRYQFILMSELESGNMVALNTFSDIDAVAHELELIPAEARLYHLDEFSPDTVATHYLFVGAPSVNQLVGYVIDILNGVSAPMVTVDMSGEETSIIIREDLLEEEED